VQCRVVATFDLRRVSATAAAERSFPPRDSISRIEFYLYRHFGVFNARFKVTRRSDDCTRMRSGVSHSSRSDEPKRQFVQFCMDLSRTTHLKFSFSSSLDEDINTRVHDITRVLLFLSLDHSSSTREIVPLRRFAIEFRVRCMYAGMKRITSMIK